MPTPRIAYHAKTKGMAESLVKRLTGVSELFGGRLNRQQKNALHTMHGLLGPDKFGGKDRTFHYGDREAIVNSLMKDKPGLSKLTSKRLSRDGKNFRAGLVEKAFSDRLAFIGGAVKNRVNSSAKVAIEKQIGATLKRAKVDSKTSSYYDDAPRKLEFRDAAKFQRALNVFRSMQRDVEKRLGVDLVFSKGISQEFVAHILEGRAGFPPGIALRDRNR